MQIVAADKLRRGFEKPAYVDGVIVKKLAVGGHFGRHGLVAGNKTHQRAFKKAHVDKQRAARKAQDLARNLTHRLRILLILMVIGASGVAVGFHQLRRAHIASCHARHFTTPYLQIKILLSEVRTICVFRKTLFFHQEAARSGFPIYFCFFRLNFSFSQEAEAYWQTSRADPLHRTRFCRFSYAPEVRARASRE